MLKIKLSKLLNTKEVKNMQEFLGDSKLYNSFMNRKKYELKKNPKTKIFVWNGWLVEL